MIENIRFSLLNTKRYISKLSYNKKSNRVKFLPKKITHKINIKLNTSENKLNKLKKSNEIDELSENNYINSKNDDIWKHIFDEINYDGKSEITITAEQIKKCKNTWSGKNNQFEPRLLCKQDCDLDRPKIFKDNNLYIVPVKNGEYLLTNNSIYFRLTYKKIKIIKLKKNTNSLLLSIGNSETSLIDNLRYSGLFEKKQYLKEPILFGSLLNGRHRCNFNMGVEKKNIEIHGVQYETDACYESENKILLLEAKSINNIDSFNIRQLYYPYRTIYDIVKDKKEILSLFINKDKNNVIHIWKFKFNNPLVMTSIENIGYNAYIFD